MSSILDDSNISFITKISRRSIGEFTGYVCMTEDSSDDLEITEHPVQNGASITDHAYLKPASVTIRFVYTPGLTPLDQIYENLRDLQSLREPFSIVTGKRVYKDMLFKSIRVNTDAKTENVLSLVGDFQQVILVGVETTTVPATDKQKIPEKTSATENKGDKKAEPIDGKNKDTSILNSTFGGG
jgi:hypothetical protein